MKVMCIDGVKEGSKGLQFGLPALKNDEIYDGEKYTVNKVTHNGQGYQLLERPKSGSYLTTRFIPLSEIDECELLEQRKQTLINI